MRALVLCFLYLLSIMLAGCSPDDEVIYPEDYFICESELDGVALLPEHHVFSRRSRSLTFYWFNTCGITLRYGNEWALEALVEEEWQAVTFVENHTFFDLQHSLRHGEIGEFVVHLNMLENRLEPGQYRLIAYINTNYMSYQVISYFAIQ